MSCNLKGLTRKGPITGIATQPKVSHLKVSHLKMSQHLKCLVTESVFFLYSWKCLIWKCHNPKNVSSPEMSFCFIPENVSSERVLQLKLSQDWKCFVTRIVSEPLLLPSINNLMIITVNLPKRLAGINIFFSIFMCWNCSFFDFQCNKKFQNEGIIRNSGIIGGRVLLEDLR